MYITSCIDSPYDKDTLPRGDKWFYSMDILTQFRKIKNITKREAPGQSVRKVTKNSYKKYQTK